MVKLRMNTADVAAEVKCLRRLIGMRCANVYDISPKVYLFKLMNSSGVTESGESEKVLLLMESGSRLHTTEYVRDKSTTPSGFTLKLRKHIRTRRLEDVRQLGYDRIILFQFGLGSNAHYVILELYAQGNILLTDSEFIVLTLLRSHRDDDKGLTMMSRHRYPIEACRVFARTDVEKLKQVLTVGGPAGDKESSQVDDDSSNLNDTSKETKNSKKKNSTVSNKKANVENRSNKDTLKTILGEGLGCGAAFSEHIILDAGLHPNMKLGNTTGCKLDEDTILVLAEAVSRYEDWLVDVMSGQKIPEGYILLQSRSTGNERVPTQESSSDKVYHEFFPFLFNQYKSKDYLKFETLDAALDEFYTKIESQKVDHQQKTKEGSATLKLNKIRLDQENRVQTLKKEVDRYTGMAELIEYNLEDVDAAILAVRVALANGTNWEDLTRMIKEEKKSGNPVAGLIDQLNFERNCITLLLSNNLDEMDDEEKTFPVDKVEVDLALSAHANARRWYELKKKQEFKQEKTISAHEKAFKAAEKKTKLQLAQEKTVAAITHIRKVHWFEKFNWFISSENYLVISGRDAQQNEMIVKRYMSKGDIYVHADLHGASSTVIKNHKPDHPIPPLTLNQTGCFTVCHSQAWDSKIVTSAWWVYPHQVSKTAPTGEYLTVGSFMIRGKKNFLPPHPLVMGFGILFRLDESSLASHLNERRVRGEDEGLQEIEGESHKEHEESDSAEEAIEGRNEDSRHPSVLDAGRVEQDGKYELGTLTQSSDKHTDVLVRDEASHFENIHTGNMSETKETSGPSASSQLEDLLDMALGLGPAMLSSKSSVLNARQSTSVEDQEQHEGGNGSVREKPYISKAERRNLKKGQKNSSDGSKEETSGSSSGTQAERKSEKKGQKNDSAGSKEDTSGSRSSGAQPDGKSENLKPPNPKTTRGQKGKLKKIKEKYAEQDEEERKIRMTLLASSGRVSKKEKESQEQDGVPDKVTKPESGQLDSAKICYKCKKVGHLSRDCRESTSANGHNQAVVGRHVDGDAPEELTDELDKIEIEEDGIHELREEEKDKLNDIDYLTGSPLADDILLYAIPVCGPYNALQTYKYRVKITPGSAKRGKAAKMAMNLFSHMFEVPTREKELMKACTDPELFAAIMGNAKITAPGMTQLKQKQKKGKKSSSKGGS